MPSPTEPTVDDAPILHVDLDAFFASVEILDDPSLRGKPVAVGGSGERGVIASASYEARRYGIRSAMPSVVARRRCPTLVILPGRFDRYEEYSRRFHAIVRDLTPDYEPLGLDEVFADLRSLRRLDVRPIAGAWELRRRIESELGLYCGVGLARNKLFAKLASKQSKPHVVDGRLQPGAGVVFVDDEMAQRWLATLPVRALWGVGPATASKLERLGLGHVRDLAKVEESTLALHVGAAMARTLVAYARGEDDRPVEVEREAKSVGHDQTFGQSIRGRAALEAAARHHAAVVARALRTRGRVARTVSVVVRYDDLTSVSRAQTLPFGVDDDTAIAAVASALLATLDDGRAVRLLGVHASGLRERDENVLQLSFAVDDTIEDPRRRAAVLSERRQVEGGALRDALDEVRRRFGVNAVSVAADLGDEGINVERQRGSHAFGPEGSGVA